MTLNPDSSSSPSPPVTVAPAGPKKSRKLIYGCGALLALLLLIVATVAITLWWIQRPIKPVVLTSKEKAVVDEKLHKLEQEDTSHIRVPLPANDNRPPASSYSPGSKSLKITEREINGLLNANTELGKTVRIEFATDAIHAYLVVPIPEDFPVGGGKMFRARGRFLLSLGSGGTPYAILDDVTVFGISLPKAWLGGLKGENLLSQAVGNRNGSPVLKGIKSLQVESGALVLELED